MTPKAHPPEHVALARCAGRVLSAALALAIVGACSRGSGGVREGAWELKVDTAGSTAWLRGTGKEGPAGKPPAAAAILSFDCRADHTGATIMTEQALRQGTTEVALSLDGDRARTLPGFAGTTSTGGQVVLTAALDSALGLFLRGDTATVEYADGAGSSKTTAVFPLEGLEAFRDRFLAACGPLASAGPEETASE
jgi:hypothetical protein